MGRPGSDAALQHGCSVGGGEVHIAGHKKLEVLAAGCVANLDIKPLLLEVALFLRDVGGGEGQIRLRLVACHEDDLHEDDLFGFRWSTCRCPDN